MVKHLPSVKKQRLVATMQARQARRERVVPRPLFLPMRDMPMPSLRPSLSPSLRPRRRRMSRLMLRLMSRRLLFRPL